MTTTNFRLLDFQSSACIRDWLTRVDTQYDKTTPEKVKEADYNRAKESLGLGNITNNYFFSSGRPAFYTPFRSASRSWFSGDTTTNSHNTTYVDNRIYVHGARAESSSDSEDAKAATKKKKTKEEKANWKGIAAIGIVSTAVAGVSLFVYARLSKSVEGARNYLENTKRVQQWAQGFASQTTLHAQINEIANTQLKIDQRAVDKITNYKYSILTSLVGTLAMAAGGITILASAPALATAGTAAVVTGGVLNSIAVMYAAYNCGMHWSDKEEGKKEFSVVKEQVQGLMGFFESHDVLREQQPAYNNDLSNGDLPPSYDESQAIYHQRTNPSNIYPDLSGFKFAPSAPSYESLSKENY